MKETIPAALEGQRLDRLVSMLTGVSRSEAASLIDTSQIGRAHV